MEILYRQNSEVGLYYESIFLLLPNCLLDSAPITTIVSIVLMKGSIRWQKWWKEVCGAFPLYFTMCNWLTCRWLQLDSNRKGCGRHIDCTMVCLVLDYLLPYTRSCLPSFSSLHVLGQPLNIDSQPRPKLQKITSRKLWSWFYTWLVRRIVELMWGCHWALQRVASMVLELGSWLVAEKWFIVGRSVGIPRRRLVHTE